MINPGILRQIEEGNTKYYTDLTQDVLDDFLNELSKINRFKMFKRRKKSEVTLKSELDPSCDKCVCESPCTAKECYQPKYKVIITLSDKFWNEDLKRYIITSYKYNEIIISSDKVVEFEFSGYLGNLYDLMTSGRVTSICTEVLDDVELQ
jgi:hypothetical protein